jgi:hypothetical protein
MFAIEIRSLKIIIKERCRWWNAIRGRASREGTLVGGVEESGELESS